MYMDLGTPLWGVYGMQKMQEQFSENVHGPWYPLVWCVRYAEKINESSSSEFLNRSRHDHAFRYNRQLH
jgi:hypothetical protein